MNSIKTRDLQGRSSKWKLSNCAYFAANPKMTEKYIGTVNIDLFVLAGHDVRDAQIGKNNGADIQYLHSTAEQSTKSRQIYHKINIKQTLHEVSKV